MQKEEVIDYIAKCIKEMAEVFNKVPDSFQSEGDLRAFLYYLIARNPFFVDTFEYGGEDENFLNRYLHAEYSTFGKIKKSSGRLDLAIINPDKKSEFDTLVGIEIKWRDELSKMHLKEIRDDLIKLSNPENEIANPMLLLFSIKKYPELTMKSEILPHKNKSTVYLINSDLGIKQL